MKKTQRGPALSERSESNGFSLIEMLVVVAVFSLLAVITTQALIITLRGSKKSEANAKVRENVSYALSVMERQIRNSTGITSCTTSAIDFKDQSSIGASFSCVSVSPSTIGYVASGSAQLRLTSDDVDVTDCSFTCTAGTSTVPPAVTILISAKDSNPQSAETGSITSTTKVMLRTY